MEFISDGRERKHTNNSGPESNPGDRKRCPSRPDARARGNGTIFGATGEASALREINLDQSTRRKGEREREEKPSPNQTTSI